MAETSKSAGSPIPRIRSFSKLLLPAGYKSRKIQKAFTDAKITLICGFLTFVVMRSCFEGGKFRSPMDDLEDIQRGRRQLYQAFAGIAARNNDSAKLDVVDNKEKTTASTTTPPKRDHMQADKLLASLSPAKSPSDSLRKVPDQHEHAKGDPMEADRFIPSLSSAKSVSDSLRKLADRHQHAKLPLDIRSSQLSVINSVQHRKPNILLVTGSQNVPCQSAEGNDYLLKSMKNKMDYCRLHGIEMVHKMSLLDPELPGFRAKSPIIRELMLSEPQPEWIWWMDSDAIFTDMSRELRLERYEGYNLVLQAGDELVQRKGMRQWKGGANGGSFLMRNCQWSIDLLEAWARKGEQSGKNVDQFELLERMMMEEPSKVFVESSDESNNNDDLHVDSNLYREVRANRFENEKEKHHHLQQLQFMGDGDEEIKWPLVTHFVGCKPCSRAPSKASQRCMAEMQQAFKVADNQALIKLSSSTHHLPSLHQSFKHKLSI